MLVIDGVLYLCFLEDSDSCYVRNGVGVLLDGQMVWFVISDRVVMFYEFGCLFCDGLGVWDVFYFDGLISRFYVFVLNCVDFGWWFGLIIGYME